MKRKKNSVKIKAPVGFCFKIREFRYAKEKNPHNVYVELRESKTNKYVGRVSLCRRSATGSYETHSSLGYEYHKRGLGTLMYARAIQSCHDNGHTVRSSGASSDMARRVWEGKGLRKLFTLRKRKGDDKYYDKWYAYRK
jgi:GNAT superfamily N-acetyltransferase